MLSDQGRAVRHMDSQPAPPRERTTVSAWSRLDWMGNRLSRLFDDGWSLPEEMGRSAWMPAVTVEETAHDILLPTATPMALGAAALVVLLLLLAARRAFRFVSSRFVRLLERFLGLILVAVGFPWVLVPRSPIWPVAPPPCARPFGISTTSRGTSTS